MDEREDYADVDLSRPARDWSEWACVLVGVLAFAFGLLSLIVLIALTVRGIGPAD
jgi:hypothetical protein